MECVYTHSMANTGTIDEQLAAQGMRRADAEKGEPGWYVLVTDENGRPKKVWATVFFPTKPDEAVRGRLKSHGFRWAPSIGAWQAYRNVRALAFAKEAAGV